MNQAANAAGMRIEFVDWLRGYCSLLRAREQTARNKHRDDVPGVRGSRERVVHGAEAIPANPSR
jgi:hypothetical protein